MSLRGSEYEHQFWGFSAKEISTGLRKVILENIQEVINGMHSSLKKMTPEEQWPAELSSCQTLLNEYSHKATEHLRIVETYIQENFSIPSHVLLEEDSVQRQQYSDQDRENIEKEIKDLWRRINRVHFLEYHLLQELDKNEELKSISEKVRQLTLPQAKTLPSNKQLHHLVSECMGLEVEEASCHLTAEDSEDSNEYSQPNHALKAFRKRPKRKMTIKDE